jgi:hypothetical protein
MNSNQNSSFERMNSAEDWRPGGYNYENYKPNVTTNVYKKEVILRHDIYQIYTSEKQERMKIYFELNDEFNQCLRDCPKYDEHQEAQCETQCEVVYEKYPYLLQDRYKDQPEKLDEECVDAPGFTKKQREHTKTWAYSILHWRPEYLADEHKDQEEETK